METQMNNETIDMSVKLRGVAEIQVFMNALQSYSMDYHKTNYGKDTYNEHHATLIDKMYEQTVHEYTQDILE